MEYVNERIRLAISNVLGGSMNSHIKQTLAGLAISVAALGLASTTAGVAAAAENTAAKASTGLSICVDAYFANQSWGCHMNMQQREYIYDVANQIGPGFQDAISSIRNTTGRDLCFWEHNNHQGDYFKIRAGYEVANLAGSKFNDAVSSWKPC
ncbi:hypothetical protein AB0O67_23870 [Streptomyces sp. NPDC086077]|uniref:hypothetical protein n=1 Tax=Streptomyces sp. NPDC086077 TaxID=3154862 RepID=UPI003448D2C6